MGHADNRTLLKVAGTTTIALIAILLIWKEDTCAAVAITTHLVHIVRGGKNNGHKNE